MVTTALAVDWYVARRHEGPATTSATGRMALVFEPGNHRAE